MTKATVGAPAVALLSLCTDAAERGILGAPTRRCYLALREKISQLSQGAAAPERSIWSWRRAQPVDPIERSPEPERESVKALALALIEALLNDVHRGALGISLQRLDAMRFALEAA